LRSNGDPRRAWQRSCSSYLVRYFEKIEWESFSMNRSQRLVLSLVCTLALVFIPMSYLRAQSTVPQQDQTDRNSINQQNTPDVDQNQEPNLNQEKSTTPSNQDQTTREKPSSTEQDQNQYQQNQDQQNQYQQNQPDTTRGSQSTTKRSRTMTQTERSTTQRDQSSREGLPATAGELPLIALIGLLSLAIAFGTRTLARDKSNR
jgi:type IV secretory pathway VirB10-like protein